MNHATVRKTYKYKLQPTRDQEQQLETVLWRCRVLYNVALEQRILLWKQRGVSVSHYRQEAELKCTNCGLVMDRDENAARNIQWAGQALRGVAAVAAAVNRESVGL